VQRGKLLTHSADTDAELELLHGADRLMVRLIQLPHLADRVKGMLFQVRFAQNMELLKQVRRPSFSSIIKPPRIILTMTRLQSLDLLNNACDDLRLATKFQQLMHVILHFGNFMNGTNYAGGAHGFRVGSINRMVDTKSSNGQNLLHFLEKTVSTHFPHLEGFLDELARPADANRGELLGRGSWCLRKE
jgi:cytokinesis protein